MIKAAHWRNKATVLITAFLAGCAAVPRDPHSTAALEPVKLGIGGNRASPEIDETWWKSLDDAQLDRIMTDALAGNPSLEVAAARVRAARAAIDQAHAGLLPQVGIDVQEARQRLSDKYIIPPPYAGTSRWVGTAQANLSWSLDLAGRQKALVDAAASQTWAAELDLAAARITLSGAVMQAYVNLRRADMQAGLADRFVASREEQLRLARSRQTNRLGSDFDLRAAETLLAEARQARVRADGDKALMTHALAALAGRGPDYYSTLSRPQLRLDQYLPIPTEVPADLLGRRPDILAAQAKVDASDAGRRVARADFYPNVDIRAFAGFSAIGLGSLLMGGAATYGAGPAIHLPIFEGGRLRAGYNRALAERDAAIANYNDLVVRAVREVADALSSVDTNAKVTAEQLEISRGLSETVRLDEVRVRTGLGARLDVLDAQDRELAAAQRLTDLQADGALARIQLVVALGGGFPSIHGDRTASAAANAPRR